MFDLGWSELMVIGVVALIVVGPKDLPGMFRTLGRFTAKARGMARDFQRAMDDAADEAGVKDVQKSLRAAANPVKTGLNSAKGALKDAADWTPPSTTPPPKTAEMTEDRAEMAQKIQAATARSASARTDASAVKASGTSAPELAKPVKTLPQPGPRPEPAQRAKAMPLKTGGPKPARGRATPRKKGGA